MIFLVISASQFLIASLNKNTVDCNQQHCQTVEYSAIILIK